MFCSKCGSEMPDGADFCGNCGAPRKKAAAKASNQAPTQTYPQAAGQVPFQSAPAKSVSNAAQVQQNAQQQSPKSNAEILSQLKKPNVAKQQTSNIATSISNQPGFNAMSSSPRWLIAMIAGLITTILMFTPWIEASSTLAQYASGLNQLNSLIGRSDASISLSYNLFSIAGNLSEIGSNSNGQIALIFLTIPWAIILVLIIVSLILSYTKKRTKFLGVMCIFVSILAVWSIYVDYVIFEGVYGVSMWGIIALIVAIISSVLCLTNKPA